MTELFSVGDRVSVRRASRASDAHRRSSAWRCDVPTFDVVRRVSQWHIRQIEGQLTRAQDIDSPGIDDLSRATREFSALAHVEVSGGRFSVMLGRVEIAGGDCPLAAEEELEALKGGDL